MKAQDRALAPTWARRAVWLAFGLMSCVPEAAHAAFDAETLKARGIDPAAVSSLPGPAQFMAGATVVSLTLNGRAVGRVPASFDANGQLCLTPEFLQAAGLLVSAQSSTEGATPPACPRAFLERWPTTLVTLKPNALAVDIAVDPQAVVRMSEAPVEYGKGGRAAVLNYDILASNSTYHGGQSRYVQAQLESGFNAGDWIFRSGDVYSSYNGRALWNHVDAYVQRTFDARQQVLQAGQINLGGSLFGGLAINGVQVMPEQALRQQAGPRPVIRGIARSQARVDVRQNGISLYTTVVPPGEFTLTDVTPRWVTYDLIVTVYESDGEERSFVVPAATLGQAGVGPAAGLSAAVGQMRATGGARTGKQSVAAVEYGVQVNDRLNLTAGGVASNKHVATGARVDAILPGASALSAQARVSDDRNAGERGMQWSLNGSTRLPLDISLSASYLQNSKGYRDIGESPALIRRHGDGEPGRPVYGGGRVARQMSGGVSWSNPTFGGLSANVTESTTDRGDVFRRGMLSWGRSFDRVNVSLALERDLGSSTGRGGSAAYLSVSLPLGRNSVSASMQRRDGRDSRTLSTTAPLGDDASYGLSASTDGHGASYSGTLNTNLRYTQAGVAANVHPGGNSYSGRLRGGVVGHGEGLTLSPHRVQDTYAIVSVPDVPGVRISTPAGAVWTDGSGQAVVPTLTAYGTSRVQVSTPSLARNVDLINGVREIEAGRGSVSKINFEVSRVRRVLLTAVNAAGEPVTKGGSVLNARGEFVTLAGNGGQIFLPDMSAPDTELFLLDGDNGRCRLVFKLPERADADALYERANARCMPA